MNTTHTSGAADLPAIISGALFDFAGFLTTLDKSRAVTFSGAHEAGPAVTLLQEWSTKRGLNLDEADVSGWRSALTAQAISAEPAGAGYAELPAPNYPKSGGFPGTFAEAQMRAFADATHTLRASHGQAPAQPDPAYSAACHLATALFKKYFAHLPDFASGQAVWGLCGSTAGVISQIDNMVSGLLQPPATAFSEDEL